MSTILLCLDPKTVSEAELAQIRAIAPGREIQVTQDRAEIEALLPHVEIAMGQFPPEFTLKAPNLRWYHQWSAGADWLMRYPEAVERDFVLTNASGVHAINMSEQILAYLLAFSRQLPTAIRAQDRGEWMRPVPEGLSEWAGKTMVLVGIGAIGGRTARIASALGMRVLGVRRHPAVEAPGVEAMYGPGQLLDILPEADALVLVVPLTHATKGMIGERELQAMKPTAYLVNIGRGGVIQEEALIRALQEGWIAGAGLDVFATEPLPADSPLWKMPNVIITPHYGGRTPYYQQRLMAIFLDNLQRYQAGEPLRNVVNKKLGY